MLTPAPLRGGAGVHLTPAESRALARAVEDLVRYLVVHLGWGWGSLVIGALAALGAAGWNFDVWWPPIREWLEK